MEYQNNNNNNNNNNNYYYYYYLVDNTPYEQSKCKTKNWVKINDK